MSSTATETRPAAVSARFTTDRGWGALPAFALLLIAIILLPGCGGLPDDAAVRVNGTVITQAEVDARIDYFSDLYPGMVTRDDPNFTKIRRQTARDMVWAELERQEAERRDISLSAGELDAEIARMAEDDYIGDMERMMEEYAGMGVTEEELRTVTRERLLR
ncbi:MAG: hypothetical protein C4534_07745 [Gaiellales bacterium]|nr:MAG: hypothetical protein C4534_07745 [Gaiellales bacterium]